MNVGQPQQPERRKHQYSNSRSEIAAVDRHKKLKGNCTSPPSSILCSTLGINSASAKPARHRFAGGEQNGCEQDEVRNNKSKRARRSHQQQCGADQTSRHRRTYKHEHPSPAVSKLSSEAQHSSERSRP